MAEFIGVINVASWVTKVIFKKRTAERRLWTVKYDRPRKFSPEKDYGQTIDNPSNITDDRPINI